MRKVIPILLALALIAASFNGVAVAQEDTTVEEQTPDHAAADGLPDDVSTNNGPPKACSLDDKTFCTNSTDV